MLTFTILSQWHYSSAERFTRFALVQLFAELLGGKSIAHVTCTRGEPPGAKRPYDNQLRTAKLEKAGWAAPHAPFRKAVAQIIVDATRNT